MKRSSISPAGGIVGMLLLLAACSESATAPESGATASPVDAAQAVTIVIHNTVDDPVTVNITLSNGAAAWDETVEGRATSSFSISTQGLWYGWPTTLVATWTMSAGAGSTDPLIVRPGDTVQFVVSTDGMVVSPDEGRSGKW